MKAQLKPEFHYLFLMKVLQLENCTNHIPVEASLGMKKFHFFFFFLHFYTLISVRITNCQFPVQRHLSRNCVDSTTLLSY